MHIIAALRIPRMTLPKRPRYDDDALPSRVFGVTTHKPVCLRIVSLSQASDILIPRISTSRGKELGTHACPMTCSLVINPRWDSGMGRKTCSHGGCPKR